MPNRKLTPNTIYHIMSKSIVGYKIFTCEEEFERMLKIIKYYTYEEIKFKFSKYQKLKESNLVNSEILNGGKIVKIISYCLMPTHIHIVAVGLKENSLSKYMNVILRSYTGYFNNKYKRKGPLWESRFKAVIVKNEENLLHLTRYLHLNPVSAYLVEKPEEWKYSSYREYIGLEDNKICDFQDYLTINSEIYKGFVNDRIGYQRELEKIKHLIVE